LDEKRLKLQTNEGHIPTTSRCGKDGTIPHNKDTSRILMHCVIIGNGPSRRSHDLRSITLPTFGCNTVYRYYQPTFLVAQDPQILQQMSQDQVHTVFVPRARRRPHAGDLNIANIQIMESLPDQHFKLMLSGEWCMVLAARLGFTHLHMIGFDGGPEHADRGKTASNQTLEWCESTLNRYEIFEKDLVKHFPWLQITHDEHFMKVYK